MYEGEGGHLLSKRIFRRNSKFGEEGKTTQSEKWSSGNGRPLCPEDCQVMCMRDEQ